MKVRADFVTNSSSSSFVIAYKPTKSKLHNRIVQMIIESDSYCDTRIANVVPISNLSISSLSHGTAVPEILSTMFLNEMRKFEKNITVVLTTLTKAIGLFARELDMEIQPCKI